ncbi:MAG: DUF2769 domain-containing protein [Candidatus Aquicultor sp.]
MSKVEFNADNLNSCICPACPVQGASECAEERIENAQAIPQDVGSSDPKSYARLYCSAGVSDCDGFDGLQPCMCPGCAVWDRYELTSRYYCLRGNADEIDMR